MISEFRNHPLTDFSKEANRAKMLDAIEKVKSQLDRTYPLYINGQEVETGDILKSYNPCDKDQVVGRVHKAGKKEVEMAITAALKAFEKWRFVDPKERADYLFRGAAEMRKRQFELNAWMVFETGKNWVEADADTAEAIDFLEFYGREMLRYSEEQPLTPIPGERNQMTYIPLGVGAIIPPWNFPLAILSGMSTAAMVAGNAILLKPASDSPIIGQKFAEIMREAGLPAARGARSERRRRGRSRRPRTDRGGGARRPRPSAGTGQARSRRAS